jgi:hypothetical protein
MKKIIAIFLIFLAISSCKKLEDLNQNVKDPTSVSGESLFTGAQKALFDEMVTPNVNRNIYRLIAQQWTETTYIDESNYDLVTRTIMDNQWNIMYRDVLEDFKRASSVISGTTYLPSESPNQKLNRLAVVEVMIVFCYSTCVETWGDIPYTQSLDENIILPKYDDGLTVYKDLITRLNAAIQQLSTEPSAGSLGGADNMYGGDVNLWLKFANSLKLHMGVLLMDVDETTGKAAAEEAAPGAMKSNADNAKIVYLSAQPNNNPINENLVNSGRNDFVAANTIVDAMNTLADPRRPFYFTMVGDAYVGGIVGASNDFTAYSHVADAIQVATFEGTIFDYAQTEFLLAIASEKGWNVGGTAADHYNYGVGASIIYWGGTVEDIVAYLSNPLVSYQTAAGDWKQKIGTQMWIALYNRGFEAWTQWRLLDYPQLVAPPDAETDNGLPPLRYPYPISEQTLNGTNWAAASALLPGGADVMEAKLFWDKN